MTCSDSVVVKELWLECIRGEAQAYQQYKLSYFACEDIQNYP